MRPRRSLLSLGPVLIAALWAGHPALAQRVADAPTVAQVPRAASPVLTLDQDALFAGSAFGQRVQRELERDRAALAAENRRIEAELVEEELALTEQRSETSTAVFSEMANAFDERVQRIRQEQDSKARQLQRRLDGERQAFLEQIGPVLADLVRRLGGTVVIDRNAILLAFGEVDITDDAIAAIDAAIGEGAPQRLGGPLNGGQDEEPEEAPAPDAPE